MSKTEIGTTVVGNGTLTIGETASLHVMQHQVTSVKLVPKAETGKHVTVLSGKQKGGSRSEAWTLEGKYLFDLGTTDSTTEFLFNNRGKEMPFELVPATARRKKFTGRLIVEASEIGGDVDEDNLAVDFTFTLVGAPVMQNVGG